MLSNLSFDRSRFILNKPHTLPIIIPPGYKNAVIFSLKTRSIFDTKVFLWNPKKIEFMLNILFHWDEIGDVFQQVEKSTIYNSDFSEIYCFTIKNSFSNNFNNSIEAIVHSRLLLEILIEKVNQIKICQMNYLTIYDYLEKIEVCELLLFED